MATTLDVAELRATTTGRVLDPTDNDFVAQCSGYNLAEIHRPHVVVIPLTTQDVVHAVQFAEKNGLTVQVQATGHGSGMRADGGMLITTRELHVVSIDPVRGTARVGAGAKWSQVIDQAFEHGLAPLNGSSVTVGVVTELEFDLMPISHVYGGAIFFPGDLAPDLLHAYRQWIGTMPDSVTSSIALLRLPDLDIFPEPLRGKRRGRTRRRFLGHRCWALPAAPSASRCRCGGLSPWGAGTLEVRGETHQLLRLRYRPHRGLQGLGTGRSRPAKIP